MDDQESLDHWLSLWWPEVSKQEPEEFKGSFALFGTLDMDRVRKEDPSLAKGIDAQLKETIKAIKASSHDRR